MSTIPFQRRAPLPPDIANKLPVNLDAERSILGAILVDRSVPNVTMKTARELISPDDFSLEQNRRVFRNMLFLDDAGRPIEIIAIVENLTQNRELESAGGSAYLSSLMDGMPRISNVGYYAKVVKEKSRLRQIIYKTYQVEAEAFAGNTSPEALIAELETFAKQTDNKANPAVVVSFRSLLEMDLPPLKFLFEPLLTEGGTGEIWGWRGTGKSFIATEMGMELALGKPLMFPNSAPGGGNWPISRAYRVFYVYAEMHASQIKQRAIQIAKGHDLPLPPHEGFGLLSKDFQKKWRPRIKEATNRKYIEDHVFGGGYELLILDNLSTLWPAAQEGEGERTAVLSDWFADFNQRGVSVIYLHHAGKSGDQRGGSEKEDMLDFVISLINPPGYKRHQQLCVDLEITKIRGECRRASWLAPFEISLHVDEAGATQWTIRPSEHAKFRACFEHFANGMKPGTDLASEIQSHRSSTYRWHKKYLANSNAQHWIDALTYRALD
jgi:hypothetical protein